MKSVIEFLSEMDSMAQHKRPADQYGNGEPAPAPVGVAPAGPVNTGDAHANRPLDQNVGEPVNPPQGSSQPVDGEKIPMDPNLHWDEFQAQLQAGAVQAKPMSEDKHMVKFSKDDFGSLFTDAGLSEEFMTKAITIFEAAVNARIKKEVARLNETANNYFTDQLKALSDKLVSENTENQAKYLDYVVTEWVAENKIAIESAKKVQLAESLLEGMKSIFVEHNVDVPTNKVNMVESLEQQVAELKGQLDESISKNADMLKMLKEAARDVEILNFTRGMSLVKADKVKELAESIEFTKPSEFRQKLTVLSENLTATAPKKGDGNSLIVEDNGKPGKEEKNLNEGHQIPEMAQYLTVSNLIKRK